MNYNINTDKFNNLIDQASDAIMCNSECRNQRESDKLKNIYLNAQTNLASAPNQVELARKNYVIFTDGESAYNDLLDNQLNEKAQLIGDKFAENFNKDSIRIETQIDTYDGLLLNYKNIVELYLKYKKENSELTKDIKNTTSDVLTNERKTFYENQKIDVLKGFYFYILLGVYIILLIYFIFITLGRPFPISWISKIVSIIGFIVLPFLSTLILSIIIYLFYSAYELLPKNVYSQKNY